MTTDHVIQMVVSGVVLVTLIVVMGILSYSHDEIPPVLISGAAGVFTIFGTVVVHVAVNKKIGPPPPDEPKAGK